MRKILWAVALPPLLGGCALNLAPGRMGELGNPPESWESTPEAKAGVDSHWLKRFHDPALSRLVNAAMEGNPDIKIMTARVDQARARSGLEDSGSRPKVDANFDGNRSKRNFVLFPIPGGQGVGSNHSNSFGLSFDVRWELDLWGRARAGRKAALADWEAASRQQQAGRVSLAGQIAKTWFQLAEATEQIEVARKTMASAESTASAVRRRFEAGAGNPAGAAGTGVAAQLRLAETDVAYARSTLAERRESHDVLKRQLAVLAGRYPSASGLEPGELPAVPAVPPAGLPSELLLRRPDVLAAERMFAATGMRVKEARLAVFPSLSLTGSGGSSSSELKDILNSDFGVWSLAGNFVQPILMGGAIKAEIQNRAGAEREAEAELQKIVLQAFQEVENALSAEGSLASQEASLRETVTLALRADESARRDFVAGTGDFLTVLSAQERSSQAESRLLAVRRARLENRVALHLALGGDY